MGKDNVRMANNTNENTSTNKAFWERFSGIYDLFMKKDKAVYEAIFIELRQDLAPAMTVLEIATGTGLVGIPAAGCCKTLMATDFSEAMVQKAKRKPLPDNITFEVQDATQLTYEDAVFDAVIISNALHIMPQPKKALGEIRRVLKPGGLLVAPTFVRSGEVKEARLEKFMAFFGFRTYHPWTAPAYKEFLQQNHWILQREKLLNASFPLFYAVAVYQE